MDCDVVRSGNADISDPRVSLGPECHTLQAGGNSCKALAPPGALSAWSPAIAGQRLHRQLLALGVLSSMSIFFSRVKVVKPTAAAKIPGFLSQRQPFVILSAHLSAFFD
jgi:hypothetical protein